MTAAGVRALDPRADVWTAGLASAVLGAAAFLGLAAWSSMSLPLALVAGGLAAAALAVILTAGWVEPLPLLAVSLPLPAFLSTDAVRLPPVLPVAAVVVVGWVLGRGLDPRPAPFSTRSLVPLGLLTAAVCVSALFAGERIAALREAVNFVLLFALFWVLLDRGRARPAGWRSASGWIVATAAVAGGAAVLEALGAASGRFPLPESSLYRAAGGFGWPNELGMYLAISAPFAVQGLLTSRGAQRAAWCAGAVIIGLGLGSTFSRGSWLAVAAAPAVLLLVGEGRTLVRLWGLGLVGALAVDVVTGGALSTRLAGTTGDVLVAQRLLLTGAGLLMFQAHPIVGVGPGGFGDALEQFGPQIAGLFDFVGSAHNGYVHVAAEAGVLGLLGLLAFLGSTWLGLLRSARREAPVVERWARITCLWSFTTAIVVSLFEWPFAHGVGELIVLVAALGLARAGGGPLPR